MKMLTRLHNAARDAKGGEVILAPADAQQVIAAGLVLGKHDENYMPSAAQRAVEQVHKTAKTVVP